MPKKMGNDYVSRGGSGNISLAYFFLYPCASLWGGTPRASKRKINSERKVPDPKERMIEKGT